MRVAVCDDDPRDLGEILLHMGRYAPLQGCRIEPYRDTAAFYAAHRAEPFDLVLLDIQMPAAPSGYDIAQKLVQTDPEPPLILFVTNSMDYAIKGYGVAFRYIKKPLQPQDFFAKLDDAVKEISAKHFVFSAGGANRLIRLREIYFFEVYDHNTLLHTQKEVFTMREPLQSVGARLPLGRFGAPHPSYLVNLDHIRRFSKTEVCLDNGDTVPISRRRYDAFSYQLYRFVER